MLKRISSSDLRTQIRQVLNAVSYGQDQYVVEKFGEPAAVIINMDDFQLLESARSSQSANRLEVLLQDMRERSDGIDESELVRMIEEARTAYVASVAPASTDIPAAETTDD